MNLIITNNKPIIRKNNNGGLEVFVFENKREILPYEVVYKLCEAYKIPNGKISNGKIVAILDDEIKTTVYKMCERVAVRLHKYFKDYVFNEYAYPESYYYKNLKRVVDNLLGDKMSLREAQEMYKDARFAFVGNAFVGMFSLTNVCGLSLMSNSTLQSKYVDSVILEVSKNCKNFVYNSEYYTGDLNHSGKSWHFMNLVSRINKKYKYDLYYGAYLSSGISADKALLDYIENKYFVKDEVIDFSKVELLAYSADKFEKFVKNQYESELIVRGTWNDTTSNLSKLIGFHYAYIEPSRHSENEFRYVCAIYKGKIIGVIKIGLYGYQEKDHQAICYIDVMETCRRKGVASYMIKHIDRYLFDDYPLMITQESELGEKCHIAEKFKKAVKKVRCKTYEEAMADGMY